MLLFTTNPHKSKHCWDSPILSSPIDLVLWRLSMVTGLTILLSSHDVQLISLTSLQSWESVIREINIMVVLSHIWIVIRGWIEMLIFRKGHMGWRLLLRRNCIMSLLKLTLNKWCTWQRTTPSVLLNTQSLMQSPPTISTASIFTVLSSPCPLSSQCSLTRSCVKAQAHYAKVY